MSNWRWEQIDNPWKEPKNISAVFALNPWRGHLYLGTRNLKNGGEALRSADGVHWESIAPQGFGNTSNKDIYGFVDFKDMLYAGTYNAIRGDRIAESDTGAQVWRSADGTDWKPVVVDGFGDPNNQDMFNFVSFEGHLYVGTWNPVSGAEIWRTSDGTEWKQVFKVASKEYDYIRAFATMEGRLYASTGKLAPYALYQTSDGVHWSDVVGGRLPDYLTDGFRIAVVDDVLVASLTQWYSERCVEVWRYYRDRWERINEPGFGFADNHMAGGMTVHDGRVALATWNETRGTQVWICDNVLDPTWHQINQDGFGDARNVGCVFGMTSFTNRLYVGTAPINENGTSQLWAGAEID
jgi:hypothetical protein